MLGMESWSVGLNVPFCSVPYCSPHATPHAWGRVTGKLHRGKGAGGVHEREAAVGWVAKKTNGHHWNGCQWSSWLMSEIVQPAGCPSVRLHFWCCVQFWPLTTWKTLGPGVCPEKDSRARRGLVSFLVLGAGDCLQNLFLTSCLEISVTGIWQLLVYKHQFQISPPFDHRLRNDQHQIWQNCFSFSFPESFCPETNLRNFVASSCEASSLSDHIW